MVMATSNLPDSSSRQSVVTMGNLAVNLDNFRVAIDGEITDLTFHEMELLRIFVANLNRIVTYNDLAMFIWGNARPLTLRHLNVLVHRLRTKMAASDPYVIETVRSRGYGLLKARDSEDSNDWS